MWGCGAGCSSDAKSGAAKAVKTLEDLSVMLECDGDRVAHKVSLSRFCADTPKTSDARQSIRSTRYLPIWSARVNSIHIISYSDSRVAVVVFD